MYINYSYQPKVRHLGHAKYQEAWTHFERTVDEYICYIIESGVLYIEEDGVDYTLEAGDIFFLEPNKLHRGYKASCCDYYYIHFKHEGIVDPDSHLALPQHGEQYAKSDIYTYHRDVTTLSSLKKHAKLNHNLSFVQIVNLLRQAIDSYYRRDIAYHEINDAYWQLCIITLLTWSNHENGLHKQPNTIVNTLLTFIQTNYHEAINSTRFETLTGYNIDYLNRLFKSHTGSSLHNYVIAIRIERAKELLRTTQHSITSISQMVGFNDQYFFSKTFKKHTQHSPTAFRNINKTFTK